MIGLLTSTLIPTISAKRHVVEPIPQWELLIMISVIVGLVLVGGLVAGLTIGLMSLDSTNIAILKESGTPSEQKCAKKIEPLRRNGHLLLVTFLLVNTIVNETLPIMFDAINFTGAWAVLMSTCLIVIFGEIIPQAVCAKYGLQIGAFFAGPVKILIYMFYIVAWPIASLLDYFLGHKAGNIYRHAGLKELVAIHGEDNQGPLSKDEVSVLRAVLDLRSKTAKDIMTSLENVFMLSIEDKLDRETIVSLLQAGFSRVPVYLKTRQDILGCVLTKQFILNDPDAATPVSALKLRKLPLVRDDTPLFELLHIFEAGGTHMALIVTENLDNKQAPFGDVINTNGLNWSLRHPRKATKTSYEIIGIATMEDVLEELIGHEIIDETDVYVDNRTNTRVTRIESESSINSSDSESLPFLHQAAKKNSALHYRTIDVPTSAIFNRQGLLAAVGHRKQGSSSRERKASRTRKEQFVASELAADYQEKRGSTSSRPGSPIPEEPEFAIKME